MQTVELFAGTGSFSKVAKAKGHSIFRVEIDPIHEAELHADIFDIQRKNLPKKVDMIWCSPPCTTFSVASLRHYWINGKPKNAKTWLGIALIQKTLDLIKELQKDNPHLVWFIENPRGMLRKQPFMQNYHRNTVTYCQYGLDYMKPTDIWTNCFKWLPKKPCKAGASCHTEARRGSKTGVQGVWDGGVNNVKTKGTGLNRAQLRAVIPFALFEEIFDSI